MYNLLLFERLMKNDPPPFIENITTIAKGWQRSIRAIGGYWLGSFQLDTETEGVSREKLLWWYNHYLENHLEEETFGLKSWEGIIYEMLLTLDGVQYRRTLDKEWFQNKIRVFYRDAGVEADTGWSENTDASDAYGEMQYIDTISEATSAAATALRATRLADYAFPTSRMVGGLEFGIEKQSTGIDSLQITVAGYVFTLNWRYRETSIAATAANTAVEDLADDSEFVVAGTIDSNSLSVDVDCTTPQRLWDAIEDIIVQGDASGNRWVGGVFNDRKFNYNQAATSVEYYIKENILRGLADAPVVPSMLKPDFIVQNSNAPSGSDPIGGGVGHNPRNAWIAEVEFVAPETVILKPAGFEDVQVLQEQLR